MTILADKRGTWINQYAEPAASQFLARLEDVDYVVIKYGQETRDGRAFYEALATQAGKPWCAELMPERGPAFAEVDGQHLGEQAAQPGCVAAVVNMEEADGSWHTDDGSRTNAFLDAFAAASGQQVPIFASIDTRGNRPDSPYQVALAQRCAGVMPMVYPQAFRPAMPTDYVQLAFNDCITARLRDRWSGKEIIPTLQLYGPMTQRDAVTQAYVAQHLYDAGTIAGANTYTMGHATDEQWRGSLTFETHAPGGRPGEISPEVLAALVALRAQWTAQWHAIAEEGTAAEALALAKYWSKLTT